MGLDPVFSAHGQWTGSTWTHWGWANPRLGPEIDSADAVAGAVASFASKTFSDERFAVLGNSFGGRIACHLMAEFVEQVLGLALLCPVAVADHGPRLSMPGVKAM
ncbi:alpha/beta fold hydrolase [Paenarthrobacter aurescens]|uniref:AB hydrolase-1 domain-containing protein n=1 Tax=Paenarthrobacter aurescens TaxID=43663 RepID=A0A4Y3NIK7_PAEAU|nr:alpha/beta fold hydrolase [Paenarthrobacter aurescens]MDO6141788.1 alpha/beta hydrolase [Paenarthrobacter aurescens]MDO6149551.1 alpha/beta hydrolase [Paenarthrobacter aurescens]MDO6156837.1 alpha/beta hydrolase [Paenarthrobacter aurescens]MDO6160823.1 alpha/beta hydrolase [Paenarthrobacter aurescens]GEB18559.1 hypothetical protein AAU01_13140 [Paenarthrobacter aurescens]